MDATSIAARLDAVRARIRASEAAAGRVPGSVRLVAVSKFHPESAVVVAHAASQREFGESRVQELAKKANALRDTKDLAWHMIGSVQTNKVGELLDVPSLALLHSLDREKLAHALQKELARRSRRLPALVQVHATGEATKHGCAIEELDAFVATVRAQCPAIELRGLMAMGPLEGDPAPVFARVQQVLHGLRRSTGLALPELSMGMSSDLEVAVLHGATMVRVGTDVFGARADEE